MGDIAYRLIVDMSTRGSLAPQLGTMQSQAKGVDATFKGLGSSLASGLSAAASSLERIGDKAVDVLASTAKWGAMGAAAGAAYGVGLNVITVTDDGSAVRLFAGDLEGSLAPLRKFAPDLNEAPIRAEMGPTTSPIVIVTADGCLWPSAFAWGDALLMLRTA